MVFLIAFLGAAIGSFLGVVVDRYNTGLGLGGRSMCFTCQRTLKWYELVPVFSFLLLGAKCLRCGAKLSWEYLFIEVVTALVFVLSWLQFGLSIEFLVAILMGGLFVVLSFYDYRHKILPDVFVLTVGIVAVLLALLGLDMGAVGHNYQYAFYAIGSAAPFGLLWLFSRGRLMGFGDVKLIAVLGLLLGRLVISMLLISFWVGALVGIAMLIISKISLGLSGGAVLKQQIPFGPFLLGAAFLVLLYGNVLAQLWPNYFVWLL